MDFYPRPPRGGRPGLCKPGRAGYPISIHALREEGDFPFCDFIILYFQFLSTPSARRATYRILVLCVALKISIHALREEGDCGQCTGCRLRKHFYPRPPRGGRRGSSWSQSTSNSDFYPRPPRGGRQRTGRRSLWLSDFYPRPPRGGRPPKRPKLKETGKFLSTPSARRATAKTETKSLFSYKLYNILHEFRRALIYNGSKNDPNHAK